MLTQKFLNMNAIASFILAFMLIACTVAASSDAYVSVNDININLTSHIVTPPIEFRENTLTKLLVRNIPSDVGFFVVQVHSYMHTISLSNTSQFSYRNTVNGTNIGLVKILLSTDVTKTIPFYIGSDTNTTAIISVTPYNQDDPIPGGCSMTFSSEVAPYLDVSYDKALIQVQFQAPSEMNHYCEQDEVHLEMYHVYLNRFDYNIGTYFDTLKSLMTVDKIRQIGMKVPSSINRTVLRHSFGGYPGLGQAFAVIASSMNYNTSSVYVPALTYSCDISDESDTCDPDRTAWTVFSVVMIVAGFIIATVGHMAGFEFFTQYVVLLCSTTYALYLILFYSIDYHLIANDIVYSVLLIVYAVLFTVMFIIICKRYQCSSRFGRRLVDLTAGILFAALFMVVPFNIIDSVEVYWIVFAICVVVFASFFCTLDFIGHKYVRFPYSFIGIFILTSAISYLTGGLFSFVVSEMMRHLTVRNYSAAIRYDFIGWGLFMLILFASILTTCIRPLRKTLFARRGYTPL